MEEELFKVRSKRNKNWFYLDNEYLNGFGKHFGAVCVAIYVSLCRHADSNTQKCYPSQKTIAKELKISERTVRDYIKLLEKHKIIQINKERTNQGKWLNNTYYLLDKTEWVYPEATVSDGQPEANNDKTRGNTRPTQRQPLPTNNTHTNNTHKNNTHIRSDKPTTRQSKTFKKENYNIVLEEYQKLRDITLQGKEFDPVMQDIKTMFMSERSVEDIIGCMKWLASKQEEWMENWTIKTVKLKVPFYITNKDIPYYKEY